MITTEPTVFIQAPLKSGSGRVYKWGREYNSDMNLSLSIPTQFIGLDDPDTKPIGWHVPVLGKRGPVNRKERRIEAAKARSKKNGKRRRIRK